MLKITQTVENGDFDATAQYRARRSVLAGLRDDQLRIINCSPIIAALLETISKTQK